MLKACMLAWNGLLVSIDALERDMDLGRKAYGTLESPSTVLSGRTADEFPEVRQ